MIAPAGLVDQQTLKMKILFHSFDMSQTLQVKQRNVFQYYLITKIKSLMQMSQDDPPIHYVLILV